MAISRGNVPWIAVLILTVGLVSACGARISERELRQSDLRYDAAYELWKNQNDVLGAIRNLVRAIELNPNNADAHYLLGTIQLTRGDLQEAETHLREALRINIRFPEANNSLGVLYLHQKRYPEAEQEFQKAIKDILYREPWIARGNLGWCYIELGRYQEAVDVINRALFDQPRFCVGYYRLGQAYYRLEEYEKAYKVLKTAVGVDDPACRGIQEAYWFLGLAALKKGFEAEAMDAFKACQKLMPDSPMGEQCAKEAGPEGPAPTPPDQNQGGGTP